MAYSAATLPAHPAQSVSLMATIRSAAVYAELKVPRPSANAFVDSHVFCVAHDLKVLRAIIGTVAIDVMDVIFARKRPADQRFTNESMLSDSANTRGVIDHHVSIVDARVTEVVVRLLAREYGLVAARTGAILRQVRLVSSRLVRRIAMLADAFDGTGSARITGHWSLQSTSVRTRSVPALPSLSYGSILPFTSQKAA